MLSTNCKSIVVMTDSDHKAYHYHPLKKKKNNNNYKCNGSESIIDILYSTNSNITSSNM